MFARVFVQSSGVSYGGGGRLNKKKTVNALIKGSRDPKKKVDFYPLVNHVKCCMTIYIELNEFVLKFDGNLFLCTFFIYNLGTRNSEKIHNF